MMQSQRTSQGHTLAATLRSLWSGLLVTWKHLRSATRRNEHKAISDPDYFKAREGVATIQYPHELLPIPDNGRYRLHNEIDDCIVCDKCAKICPVDCITMEPIRAVAEIGKTSDGTPKRLYAASFDIDMGKCCFCGLCTTVCPTECLTMTRVFDFSSYDIRDHYYSFAEMTEAEIAEKKAEWEAHQKEKAAAATKAFAEGTPKPSAEGTPKPPTEGKPARPVFKPRMKPPGTST
jgi:formate hydrogenlyase subunit 6/NADH:ubiquinone oxidoreductase subunit I